MTASSSSGGGMEIEAIIWKQSNNGIRILAKEESG